MINYLNEETSTTLQVANGLAETPRHHHIHNLMSGGRFDTGTVPDPTRMRIINVADNVLTLEHCSN